MTKILVIEDEQAILGNILETLELEGYEAVGAGDGRAGVALAQEHLPDLIVCDIMMPKLDGYGVLLELRNDPTTALIPFVFLTARATRDDMRQGMVLGADDYLTKPFTPPELLGAVQARLERQTSIVREYHKKLDDLRNSIIYMLPHELRTPLTGILGYSELLALGGQTMEPDRVVEMALAISRAGNRLFHLIENFLVYAQLELISRDPERVAAMRQLRLAQPRALIEYIARTRAQQARREADLTLDVMEVPTVQIEKDNLQKIVEELVDNAFKFSPLGTPVRVAADVVDDTYLLDVCDCGRGMTAQEIATIDACIQFQRQLHEQQGGGLGLVIARNLAELHGGQLTIESVPDQQTIVHVALPLG
jgi:two-component system sensor histidine kinase/response regulator